MNPIDEIVHTPLDKRAPGTGMPLHRRTGSAPRQGSFWAEVPVIETGGVWGAFPARFLARMLEVLGTCKHAEILHVCSGSLSPGVPGVRVDVRECMRPDVVADGRHLPFPADTFEAVLIDPPWSVEYAHELYGTDYPRPSHLLREAARVLRPGGRVAIVHFLVPSPQSGLSIERVLGITQGCGYRIRAVTVMRNPSTDLFDEAPA